MITENDVIDYVERHFVKQGGKTESKANTKQKGIDLIIDFQDKKFFIEAKGETSSKEHSNRYGQAFTTNQITNHIARAIFTTLKLQSKNENKNEVYIIAFPNTAQHKIQLEKISARLKKINIEIYLVNKTKIEIL